MKDLNDPAGAYENARRELVAKINAEPGSREALEQAHGQVWDTKQLQADFEVQSFLAPFIFVRRKADGVRGALEFQHNPRFYWGFSPS